MSNSPLCSHSPMSNRRRHEGNRDAPPPSACIGVFGLSLYTTERELEKEFSRFGPLDKVQVVLDGKVRVRFDILSFGKAWCNISPGVFRFQIFKIYFRIDLKISRI